MIAASAVAPADSLITLLPLAVEAVRIAFRTGSFVSDVAGRLVRLSDALDSWSTVVAVTDKEAAETALKEWNQIHVKYIRSFRHVLSLILSREPLSPIKSGSVHMRPIPSPSVARRPREYAC